MQKYRQKDPSQKAVLSDSHPHLQIAFPKHLHPILEHQPICDPTLEIFSRGSTAVVGLGLLYEVPQSHSDASHSVGLLWTSDQPVAETST
jgi:hypothetical protein